MIIRFHVSNFLSFNDEIEFSMIPSKTQQHDGHIVTGEGRYGIDILKAAVIYGPNASGKSNLIKAMSFAKNLILEGTKARAAISRKPFKLDRSCSEKPTKFEFEFKQNSHNYVYGLELDSRRIYSEWLYEIKKTTEKMLFERITTADETTKVEFGVLRKNSPKKEREFLEFVAKGTRPNQPFLTESIERDVKFFVDVYDWFLETLVIIFPESIYVGLATGVKSSDLISKRLVYFLEQFGTGICGFSLDEIPPKEDIPEEVLSKARAKISESSNVSLLGPNGHRYILALDENKELKVFKLMLKHKVVDCEDEVLMDTSEESDGTLRLMDLIPILYNLGGKDRVFVIDELDRSLHPTLSYELIHLFLQSAESQAQLIVTTHESGLLDLDLLRRDEIWFIEKDRFGASKIYSLEEFTPRYDSDIRKGYLLGRFGAIPMVGQVSF